MRLLLTGATGFLGPHVMDQLVARGDCVTVLAMPGTERYVRHPDAVRVVTGDLLEPAEVARATRGADTIYHLATTYPAKSGGDSTVANVRAAACLLRAAAAAGVRRFVFVSSVAVYEPVPSPWHWPITEASSLRSTRPTWVGRYSDGKIAVESEIRRGCRDGGMQFVIIRPPEVYGPPRRYFQNVINLAVYRPQHALAQARRFGAMQWVYVSDFAAAVAQAGVCPSAADQVINIAGDELFTMRELIPVVRQLRRGIFGGAGTPAMGRSDVDEAAAPFVGDGQGNGLKFSFAKAHRIMRFTPRVRLNIGLRSLVTAAGASSAGNNPGGELEARLLSRGPAFGEAACRRFRNGRDL